MHAEQITTQDSGFRADIRGASLWDLVQMECLTMSHRVIRVSAADEDGHLYFSGGQIVHASTGELTGEAAALQILSWKSGSLEPGEAAWPERESIHCNWQSLVMRAAQESDERSESISNLVLLQTEDLMPSSANTEPDPTPPAPTSLMNPQFLAAVRLTPDGEILEGHGDTEELASIIAYSMQLVELIGQQLGMEDFQEMECEFSNGRCIIQGGPDGTYIAVKPQAGVTAAQVRQILATA